MSLPPYTLREWCRRLVLAAGVAACSACTSPLINPEVTIPAEYQGEVFTTSVFVRAPIALSPLPNYLTLRRDLRLPRGVKVRTRVEYVVDEAGRVIAGRVLETNHRDYAQALLAGIAQVRFVPGSREGQPVKVRMELTSGATYNR